MAQALTFAIPNKTVPTAAALTALTGLAAYNDFAIARIASYENDFELITSGAALVADEILASSDGARRWFRIPVSSRKWALQSAWFVNQATGSNENDGASNATPLLNPEELYRRLGYGAECRLAQITTFNFQGGDYLQTVPSALNLRLGAGVYVVIQGVATTTSTGTMTGSVNLARPTLTSVTTNGVPDASTLTGQRITDTTAGGNLGKFAWIERAIGANNPELSPWTLPMPAPNSGLPTQTTVTVNDTYKTETLSRLDSLRWRVVLDDPNGTTPNFVCAYVYDCDLQDSTRQLKSVLPVLKRTPLTTLVILHPDGIWVTVIGNTNT